MRKTLVLATALALAGAAGFVIAQQTYPKIETPPVIFENDRVVVQLMDLKAGEWSGEHPHEGNQMVVFLEDGMKMLYKDASGETERTWNKGDIFWVDATKAHDHKSLGSGKAVLITLK